MGKFIYNSSQREIEIDDRVLAHLRVAILNKLRRSESFAMTWEHGVENGSGRTTFWLHIDPAAVRVQRQPSAEAQPTMGRAAVARRQQHRRPAVCARARPD